MMEWSATDIVGIVGGMGPLASAEFLRTIYRYSVEDGERHAPSVILHSDPTMPDRTEALLGGQYDILYERLLGILTSLAQLGATRFVITCVTIHYLVPCLPAGIRERIESLLDTIFEDLSGGNMRRLLVCTLGTRMLGTFETDERWKMVSDFVLLPEQEDQQSIHEMIYRIKRNQGLNEARLLLESLRQKYGVGGFVAGCTELHLLGRYFDGREVLGEPQWLDPLDSIARKMNTKKV